MDNNIYDGIHQVDMLICELKFLNKMKNMYYDEITKLDSKISETLLKQQEIVNSIKNPNKCTLTVSLRAMQEGAI